ncbi:MAG TPA: hypothetical protein VK646_10615 [Actinomycetota bacterium]|nr:hypothetical protein [Actinomycetota bacterium]
MRIRRLAILPCALIAVALSSSLPVAAGPPGTWTKITTGKVSIINEPGLYRTSDGVLHVVYEREVGTVSSIGHTAIAPTGAVKLKNLAVTGWQSIVHDPKAIGMPGGGVRLVFGGVQSINPGYWTDGRTYTATGTKAGTGWVVPMEAIGLSHNGAASYGTGAVTLADGTPIAGFPLNNVYTWHVGTSEVDPDQTIDFGSGTSLYWSTLVRDGSKVYVAFYALGPTAAKNGIFVAQIYPTIGPVKKVPGSSVGKNTLQPGQAVAMAVRSGGGTWVAFCVGYPTCKHIGLWKVGTTKVHTVPGSANAQSVAMSAAPGGRLWVAWATNSFPSRVHVVRSGPNGYSFGKPKSIAPPGKALAIGIYHVAIEGSRAGKADLVINTGAGLFATQVKP